MTRFINRVMLAFGVLFTLGVVVVGVYQVNYVIPRKQCEGAGKWWEPKSHTCATPIYIPHITGRPMDTKAAAAAAAAGLPEAEARSPKSEFDPRPDF